MDSIKLISLNVAGLNSPFKRTKIAKLIKATRAEIVFSEETHLRTSEEKYLKSLFKGQLYHAAAPTKTKGVLIGISAQLAFKLDSVERYKDGRFLVVQGFLQSQHILLVNIYAPNTHQNDFLGYY